MAPPTQAATVLPAPSRRRTARPAARPRPVRRRTGTERSIAGRSVRVAQAVARLPESGAVRGLSRTRFWIAVIAVLLTGLVAVNLVAVSFGTEASRNLTQIQALERENAILESTGIAAISIPHVQEGAKELGMVSPDPTTVRFVEHSPSHVAAAAQRLAAEGG
jgi:hypothetical protein